MELSIRAMRLYGSLKKLEASQSVFSLMDDLLTSFGTTKTGRSLLTNDNARDFPFLSKYRAHHSILSKVELNV